MDLHDLQFGLIVVIDCKKCGKEHARWVSCKKSKTIREEELKRDGSVDRESNKMVDYVGFVLS